MSFIAQLPVVLIREMRTDVMRIFVDEDEMWKEFMRQISAAYAAGFAIQAGIKAVLNC